MTRSVEREEEGFGKTAGVRDEENERRTELRDLKLCRIQTQFLETQITLNMTV